MITRADLFFGDGSKSLRLSIKGNAGSVGIRDDGEIGFLFVGFGLKFENVAGGFGFNRSKSFGDDGGDLRIEFEGFFPGWVVEVLRFRNEFDGILASFDFVFIGCFSLVLAIYEDS